MNGISDNVKRAIPIPIKEVLKQAVYRFRNRSFKPYLKKKNVEGVIFDFWIGDRDGRDWYDLQCTDPIWDELRFLRDNLIDIGDVILECGGHHGCTAIVLSNWVSSAGKVVTFEPFPKNCDIIEKNIKQNGLRNMTLERKAVGAVRGVVSINNASNSSVTLSGAGVQVEMTCLDDYEHLNPTFLKIDVEGFEMQVLQGAEKILSTHPKLAIEIHTEQLSKYGASVQDLFRLIDVESYKLWIQWEDGQEPREYDMKTPIEKRVHLFGVPHASESA
ncbi:FkbM family methyltransferase [Pseudomonadota bacterium]